MAGGQRELTIADIAGILAVTGDADGKTQCAAVERLAADVIGFELFTILKTTDDGRAVTRVYSSDEAAYPVGGRKELASIAIDHAALDEGEVLLAADRDEVAATFPDHDLLFSMGISAIMTAPIRYAGRRLGTLSLSGESGRYGSDEIARARVLAGLLVPALL